MFATIFINFCQLPGDNATIIYHSYVFRRSDTEISREILKNAENIPQKPGWSRKKNKKNTCF